MSVKLVLEVLDHAPSDWSQSERLFVAVLAEKARDSTRRAWPGQSTIARRTGLKGDSVTRMCHRLAAKGFELREQQGVDRNGRPVYAFSGQSAVYKIPKLCPLAEHDPAVCFPSEARTTVRPSEQESPDDGPGIEEESPDRRPDIREERPDGGPVKPGPSSGQTAKRPDDGPPLTVKDQPSTNPHTPVGFGTIETPLPEATRIVLDGLRSGGYGEATPDDARAVHTAVCRRYPGKVGLGYLRSMASNRSFGTFFAEIKTARAEEVEQTIRELQRTEAACEHRTPAGRTPHPTTGGMLCPLCRTGAAAIPEPVERTDPAVAAALDAYRSHATGRLSAITLIRITQEAVALHNRGVTGDQLAALASKAAQLDTGLLVAATAN